MLLTLLQTGLGEKGKHFVSLVPEAAKVGGLAFVNFKWEINDFNRKGPNFGSLFSFPQIYTDWANHYLAKSGHKRLIKDLQQDVTDGVLLAEIIQVVGE